MEKNENEKKYSEKKQEAKELDKQSFNSLIVLGKQTLGFRAAKKKGFRLSIEISKGLHSKNMGKPETGSFN